MNYLLIWPQNKEVPWVIRKVIPLRVLSDREALYYCEGDDPPGGARHVRLDGEDGVEFAWPIYETADPRAHGLLSGVYENAGTPAQEERASE